MRARSPLGGEPFLLMLHEGRELLGDTKLRGSVVNRDGTVVASSVEVELADVKKACRAILQEFPNGQTVLVPVAA